MRVGQGGGTAYALLWAQKEEGGWEEEGNRVEGQRVKWDTDSQLSERPKNSSG